MLSDELCESTGQPDKDVNVPKKLEERQEKKGEKTDLYPEGIWNVETLSPECEAATWNHGLSNDVVECSSLPRGNNEKTEDLNDRGQQSVYKVDTVARLHNLKGMKESTACTIVESPGGFCVAVEKQIHLFDSKCSTHNTTITFDCPPELVAYNRDSKFLVVGDSFGTIHFVHVESESVVFSRELLTGALEEDGRPMFLWLGFLGRASEETEELLVILRNMTMCRFTNMSMSKLGEAMASGNAKWAAELYQMIIMEKVDLMQEETDLKSVHDVAWASRQNGSHRIVVAGKGRQPLTVWHRSKLTQKTMKVDAVERLLKGCGLLKAQVDPTGRLLLLLDDSGRLSIWDFEHLFMIHHYNDTKIIDFMIMRTPSQCQGQLNIVTLTELPDVAESRFIQVIHMPSFTVTHHVRVSRNTWLVKIQQEDGQQTAHAFEDGRVHFVEGIENQQTHRISELYIRALAQTVPLYRFEQLLQSQRFAEAERFAESFELDVQLVLKTKLRHMIASVELRTLSDEDKLNHFVDGLIADLKLVEDESFCIEFCLEAMLPSFRATYRLLAFARSLAQDSARRSHAGNLSSSMFNVHQAIRRIGTYQLISFEKLNRRGGSASHNKNTAAVDGDGFDCREWHAFRIADLVAEIRDLLRSEDVRLAIVIWKRHYLDGNILPSIHQILADVPEHAALNDFVPWLRNEVLPIVQQGSDRAKLAIWIEQRARFVEAREKKPHGALEVIRLLDTVALPGMAEQGGDDRVSSARDHQLFTPATPAHYVENTILFGRTSTSTFGFESSSGKVWANGLKKQLEDLVYLWDKHDFCLTLNDYSQFSLNEIAKDLLDRVAAPELLGDAIEKHFRPYVERNALSFDELLAEYCVDLMDGSMTTGGTNTLADSSWQARVLAILSCMVDADIRADVVLELMKRTPVPWGSDVGRVFIEALQWSTTRKKDELREQYRLLKLKRMLIAYGITTFNISDKTLARGLLPRILGRIDLVNAMRDALQVVSAYHHLNKMEAYRIRLMALFEAGKVSRALRLLESGVEEDAADEMQPDADGLGLETDQQLDLIEKIGVGKEVALCLIYILDDAVKARNDDEADMNALATYSRTIDSLVELARVLHKIRDDLSNSPNTEHIGQSGSVLAPSNNPSTFTKSVTPFAAALDLELGGFDDALAILRNMAALFKEFGVTMTMGQFANERERRKVLAGFARKVFKYIGNADASPDDRKSAQTTEKMKGKQTESRRGNGTSARQEETDQSHTTLYRLAHVLGFERSRLRGILAEEAARNGDFRSALVLCKELYDKFPDGETARTLQRVAHLLTRYGAEHKEAFRDVKEFGMHSRLTSRILQLSGQAFCVCDADAIQSCLDDFKNYELQHRVFTQCDAGDYGALVASNVEPFDSNVFDESHHLGQSSNSPSSSSNSASSISSPKPAPTAEMEIANIGDKFAASVFEGNFRESSLVLSTESAMGLVSSFVLDASAFNENGVILGFQVDDSAKGKGESERGHPAHSGRLLAEFLVNNKSWQTVLWVLQRAKEAVLRVGQMRESSAWDTVIAFYCETLRRLSVAVLSSRMIDQKLAVGCLVSLPLEQAFEAYKAGMATAGQEYARVLHIAGIGIALSSAWKQRTFRINCEDLAANAKWWHQLRLLGIPFDNETFRYRVETGGHQRRIVPLLLARTGYDILTTLEFARSYDIEDDFVIVEYVKGLLLANGDEKDYQSRVAGILDDVVNKERLLNTLMKECLPRFSPYDYERILFVATQILRLDPDHHFGQRCKEVVGVLADYGRAKPPSLEELIEAKRIVSGGSIVSEQATIQDLKKMFPKCMQRLPYHALSVNPWLVLGPELTEESIPRLRPLRKVLNLNLDKFYVIAVENMFQLTAKEGEDGVSVADVQPPSGPTGAKLHFSDIKRLISSISDDVAAIETLLEVAKRFPLGPDRIQAYRMAVARAERSEPPDAVQNNAEQPTATGSPPKRSTEIKRMLIVCETEHQLKCLGMTEMQSFISVQDSMTSLMHNLYLSRSEAALDSKNDLDLHGLVNDIAKRTGVDPDEFRNWLIKKWMTADVSISDEEREMYLPSMRVQINNLLNSREEIAIQMRLLYLLQSLPLQAGIQYLLNFVSHPTSKIQTLNRVRALSVLFQLASPKELANYNYQNIKNYMQMLLYLADFEELRIMQSLREFEKCDKEAFVRSLWVNHKNELKVVQLICNICLDYRVYDLTLWESALNRLLDKKVYRYLLGVLEHLTSVPELSQITSLPRVWNGVLTGCLQMLSENSEATSAMHDRMLTLVQKCPFLFEMNVDAFVDHFTNMAMKTPVTFEDLLNALRGMAALPPTPRLSDAIKRSVSRLDSSELIQALDVIFNKADKNHSQHGSAISFGATDTWIGKTWVMRAIFDRVDELRAYELLLTTKHLNDFVQYLVDCDQIEHLVIASLKAQRTTSAYDVVQLYFARHPNRLPPLPEERREHQNIECDDLPVRDYTKPALLQVYLQTHAFDEEEEYVIKRIMERVEADRVASTPGTSRT
ncbi:uncharacterized protein SPPG_04350 [Spizellomyces punctatus DAOM BR117]|uniref:Uncharacterized protein n=1 Tax=Spizellomyces punctatus (strain DAOM BR117) TaxID=645134 RepID=A0A0L0HG07_SPIPD|nr:uncharacterized protein SPPG_04350 [Spizellomyces punctatus DAOM BR117]KND00003.1 hypothetical protein SPPG_04350 [Spizellomyces punctatus DAOM BR117]|eukprot:XP_016608042.1 hypothetical protein SPPG_04350 [Spizellomyces punctatus DAOM BR117]